MTTTDDITSREDEARKQQANLEMADQFIEAWTASQGKTQPAVTIDRKDIYDAALRKISLERLRVTLYRTRPDTDREHVVTLRGDDIPGSYDLLLEMVKQVYWEGSTELWDWDLAAGRLWIQRGGKFKIAENRTLYQTILQRRQAGERPPNDSGEGLLPPQHHQAMPAPYQPSPYSLQQPQTQAPVPQNQAPAVIDWQAIQTMQDQAHRNPLASGLISEMRAQHDMQMSMLRDQIKQITQAHREEKDALKEQFRDQITALKEQWNDQRESLQARARDLDETISSLRKRADEDRRLESAEKQRLEEERSRILREASDARAAIEQKLHQREEELAEARERVRELEQELTRLEASAEQDAERREAQKEREMLLQLSAMKEAHQAEIVTLTSAAREKQIENDRALQDAVAKVSNEYEARLQRLTNEHLAELETERQKMEVQMMGRISKEVQAAVEEKERAHKNKSVLDRALEAQRTLAESRKELEGFASLLGLKVETPEDREAAAAALAAAKSASEAAGDGDDGKKKLKLFGLLTEDGEPNMELIEAFLGPLLEREGKKIIDRYEKIEKHNEQIATESSRKIEKQETEQKERAIREKLEREIREKVEREFREKKQAQKPLGTSRPAPPAPLTRPAPPPVPAPPAPPPPPPPPLPDPPTSEDASPASEPTVIVSGMSALARARSLSRRPPEEP